MNGEHAMPLFLALIALSGVAIGASLNSSFPVSGSAAFQTNSGVSVVIENPGSEADATFPDDNTVDIATANGNLTVSGTGAANVTIDEITGTWTNASSLDVATSNATINPEDKAAATVGGDVDSVSYKKIKPDDGTPDLVYQGASGTTTLIIRGLEANKLYSLVDKSNTALGGGQTDASGTLAVTGLPNSKHVVEVESQQGGPGLSNPQPEGPQSTTPTELSIDVDDPDFDDGEEVDVTFSLDGTQVGTNTVTSAGTTSVSISDPGRGGHNVEVTATDPAGNTNTLTYSFSTPENLTVLRATAPHEIIDDREVTATFIDDGDTVETRTTTNGIIDLSGLSTASDITMQVNASATSGIGVPNRAYYQNEYIVEDITQQQTVYLLDRNNTVVETRFTLQDRTSNFEGNGAQLFIQKPVDISGTNKYRTVHSDYFGVEGITTELEKGQRYRLIVKNDDGDTRVLGAYDADVSETVPLTIGTVSADPEDPDLDFAHNVSRVENAQGDLFARVGYQDNETITDSVTIEIFERDNRSNKLVDNQTFSGPLGSFVLSEQIPSSLNDSALVALVTVKRDGNTEQIRIPFGPRQPVLNGMAPWLRAVISIGTIFVVAGLFSQINGRFGGLVVAGLGGIFFFVNFLPKETGIGVVILSMITAGILFIKERIV